MFLFLKKIVAKKSAIGISFCANYCYGYLQQKFCRIREAVVPNLDWPSSVQKKVMSVQNPRANGFPVGLVDFMSFYSWQPKTHKDSLLP